MFAQLYHQSMKHAAGPRREIGFRTVFNLLGPLTNPARADRQLMGVYDRSRTELVALVMRELGVQRALVVASHDGLDEISISAPTQITELKQGVISTFTVTPESLGLESAGIEAIAGGDAQENARIIRSVFAGERGPRRDVVLANAGACFYVTGRSATLPDGVRLAADIIDSGLAEAKLNELIAFTEELSHVS
jgi:anthranilate phosphoribosyltransferase